MTIDRSTYSYNHPEVDKLWLVWNYARGIATRVLSKIILHLLQDGYMYSKYNTLRIPSHRNGFQVISSLVSLLGDMH